MRRNSLLDGLKVRQFDDIQDEISEMVDCRSDAVHHKFAPARQTVTGTYIYIIYIYIYIYLVFSRIVWYLGRLSRKIRR